MPSITVIVPGGEDLAPLRIADGTAPTHEVSAQARQLYFGASTMII
jgi:hypothetical protein